MAAITIKQGAALRLQLTFQNDDGSFADLTAVTLISEVRTVTGDLVAVLPIVRTPTRGVATVEVDQTAVWPIGMLVSDVKAVIGTVPILSDTFSVMVGRAVTQ